MENIFQKMHYSGKYWEIVVITMYRCQRSRGCLPVFSCSSVVSSIPGITQDYPEMNQDTSGSERWQRY
jgi:hypothetical protein